MNMLGMNLETLRNLLDERFSGILTVGRHRPDGRVCVRELRSVACGQVWSDQPDGGSPTDVACQMLNDARWSTYTARTENCLPLALLTEAEAARGWVRHYAERTIKEILPVFIRAVKVKDKNPELEKVAIECETEGLTPKSLFWVSRHSENCQDLEDVYNCIKHYRELSLQMVAVHAADVASATSPLCGDKLLVQSIRLLIECHKGAL